MPTKSSIKHVSASGSNWRAHVCIDGKQENAPTRATIEEAAADVPAMLARQREAHLARKAAQPALKAERAKAQADLLKASGVKFVYPNGSKWCARVCINGKHVSAITRATIQEAAADVPALLARQQEAQREAQLARNAARSALKAERANAHADLRKTSGVKFVNPNGGKWHAAVSINGKQEWAPTRETFEQAAADVPAMLARQREAQMSRKAARANSQADLREEHADELQANLARSGCCQALDGLSRAFLKLALGPTDVVGVDGVEYAKDMHCFRRHDDLGFDPALDVEPDDAVPTMVVELKATSALRPHNSSTTNPVLQFQHIVYENERATLVVMLYIPDDVTEATPETLQRVRFWWKHALGWKPKHGQFKPTLHGGRDAAGWPQPGSRLGEVVAREVHRAAEANTLIPYGVRARVFKMETHRRGQAAIDAFERQVLLPLGARFLPTKSGCEGGAEDRRVQFNDGSEEVAQIKLARLRGLRQAGFDIKLSRCAGSYRDATTGERKQLHKPYTQGENDRYIFVALDADEHVVEYWAPSEADLLGNNALEQLITDNEGLCGVTGTTVHPRKEDKIRLGDTARNNDHRDTHPERTRGWIQTLGPIVPPAEAFALQAKANADRRVLRLSAKAERAAVAAASASAAGPNTVNVQLLKRKLANSATWSQHAHHCAYRADHP